MKRRTKKLVALGMTAAMTAGLIAGCGKESDAGKPADRYGEESRRGRVSDGEYRSRNGDDRRNRYDGA